MEEQRPWHRLFGLTWTDFFTGQPVTVELEKDLSLKKQLLDVVPNQLPEEEHNALLHLFSTRVELLAHGRRNYHIHSRDASTLLLQLFRRIQREIEAMSNALQEFARESIDELLRELPVEKRLE